MGERTRPLRVGVDMTPAVVGITGIARYADRLWRGLRRREDVDARALAVGRGRRLGEPGIRQHPVPLRVMAGVWRAGVPRFEWLVPGVDVVHCIDLVPPPTRRPLVVTWHDTLRLSGPEYHAPSALAARRARLALLPKAAAVLVQCRATADELLDALPLDPDRVVITPPGFDLPDAPAQPMPGVDGPFVLACGAITPRKGLEVLAAAMARLGDDAPPLVVAGPDGYRAADVRAAVDRLLPAGRCVYLGERTDVASLYRRATVVCHPSLAEGFGYVCLEAMGAGAAVVAADIPSVREMAGDTVCLVPAGDPEPLADAIAALLGDDERRAELGRAARARAAGYTWDGLVEATVGAYRMVAG